ncbi:hypothetical protein [Dyadobacter sp. CY356]|uniref:hypothetical protein n=1 Tax=Dyadobacter sp. CY356 TaxID=2906442 RepID=UPI001F2B35F9|nr:hypothetical protein [Dyadobacter sp. CY356]MCF0055097.1 hypothetical protein [Dyadobacter sp. CY356]
MRLTKYAAFVILLLLKPETSLCQNFFGISTQNNSKNFKAIDLVMKGKVIQKDGPSGTLDIQVYSLFLSPGISQQVGLGTFPRQPSERYPLTIDTALDSTSSYIILRNVSRKPDSVVVSQIMGELNSQVLIRQSAFVNPGEQITLYLHNAQQTFSEVLLPNDKEYYSCITLVIK